jgi:hypothetical protein
MKDHSKRVAVLIALGLILGLILASWIILGDRLYTRHGTPVLLISLTFHAGVLPVLFAYIGGRIWNKHPFFAGWIVSAVPAIGAALAATAIYVTTPKGEFNVSVVSNNWRDASFSEFIYLAIRSIPAALLALGWVLVIGTIGAGFAIGHMKLRGNGLKSPGSDDQKAAPQK